jgi:hypothetical protein
MKVLPALFLPLAALSAAPAPAKGPTHICPHLVRDYARKAELPAGAQAVLPRMAERGGRFNVGDAIGPGDQDLPFARFVSAHQAGCSLSVRYEYGGIAHGFATALLEQRGRGWVLVRPR